MMELQKRQRIAKLLCIPYTTLPGNLPFDPDTPIQAVQGHLGPVTHRQGHGETQGLCAHPLPGCRVSGKVSGLKAGLREHISCTLLLLPVLTN